MKGRRHWNVFPSYSISLFCVFFFNCWQITAQCLTKTLCLGLFLTAKPQLENFWLGFLFCFFTKCSLQQSLCYLLCPCCEAIINVITDAPSLCLPPVSFLQDTHTQALSDSLERTLMSDLDKKIYTLIPFLCSICFESPLKCSHQINYPCLHTLAGLMPKSAAVTAPYYFILFHVMTSKGAINGKAPLKGCENR